jgi:tRNA-2-methylthio-N6-dimethylallyladenosine synthase
MDYLGVKPKAKEWWRGSVVIQTGCSNYCTYCVVPFARGHEKNRPLHAILKEARAMVYPVKSANGRASKKQFNRVKNGAKEIQLLGQTVNSHPKFAEILSEVNKIPGVNRVGFASAHPMHMTDEIIKALKLPMMMNYLHLPVQSGNDEILKKMNRKYTREKYLKIIEKIKKVRPGISLATDIIVGFPGETRRQFANTVSLYKKCDFDLSYPAMYSPRTGTAAFTAFSDDIPHAEKRRRWLVIQKMMKKNVLRKNKKFISKMVEVLVDGWDSGKCWGFSREYKKVSFNGDKKLIGQVVNVKIEKVKEWELEGKKVVSNE